MNIFLKNLSEEKEKYSWMANEAYGKKDYIVKKYILDVRNI